MTARNHTPRPAQRVPLGRNFTAILIVVLLVVPGVYLSVAGPTAPPVLSSRGGARAVPAAPAAAAAPPLRGGTSIPSASSSLATAYTLIVGNGTLEAGNRIPSNFYEPWYAAYDPVNNRVYLSAGCTVYALDPSTYAVVGQLPWSGCGVLYLNSTGNLYLSSGSHVDVVDPTTGTLVRQIYANQAGQTTYGIFTYDPAANAIVVGNIFNATLNVVSLSQDRVVANLSVGTIYAEDASYDPVNQELYVAQYENGEVIAFNSTTWASTTISIPYTMGLFVYGVAVDSATGNVYATTYGDGNYLVEILGSNNSIVQHAGLGSYPTGIVYDAGIDRLFVANPEGATIRVIDPSNLTTMDTLSLGADSLGVYYPWWPSYFPQLNTVFVPASSSNGFYAIDDRNLSIYASAGGGFDRPSAETYDGACGCEVVASYDASQLYWVNATTYRLERTESLAGSPRALAYDNATGDLWVAMGGLSGYSGIAVYNGTNGSHLASLGTNGSFPNSVTYDWLDDRMYVAVEGSGDVRVYNATNGTSLATVPLGGATQTAWDPGNDRIYVSSWYTKNVSVLAGNTSAFVTNITGVPGSNSIVYDPATSLLYTGDENAANISILDPSTDRVIGNLSYAYADQILPQPGSDLLFGTNGSGTIAEFNLSSGAATSVAAGAETDALGFLPSGTLTADDYAGAVDFLQNSSAGPMASPVLRLAPSVVGVGSNLSIAVNETGGIGPYSYSYAGLPAGCASTNASAFVCAPTQPGFYEVDVRVADSAGETINASATLWVDPTYRLTFTESGLPTGTPWSVNLTIGLSLSGNTTSLSVELLNNTIGYTVFVGAANWIPAVPSGQLTVAGGPVTVTTTFLELQPVTVEETGLPAGTSWRLSIDGGIGLNSTGADLNLSLLNGTYVYVATVPGGGWLPLRGSFDVAGPLRLALAFQPWDYPLRFSELGLPTGTPWWVNLSSGVGIEGTGPNLQFTVVNGTYSWAATTAAGAWVGQTGSVTIDGNGTTIDLRFVRATYAVDFSVVGPANGTPFWINVSGVAPATATGASLDLQLSNGSYSYAASAGAQWIGAHGNFTVRGAPVSLSVVFLPANQTVTFEAVGLAAGANWSVDFDAQPSGPTDRSSIVFSAEAGTYAYTVRGPTDQAPLNQSGSVSVAGRSVTVDVPFTPVLVLSSFTASPASTTIDTVVTFSVGATGGDGKFSFAYADLPAGCPSVNLSSWSCVPTASGRFSVEVTVTDAHGSTVSATTELTIAPLTSPVSSNGGGAAPLPWALIGLGIVVVAAGAVAALLLLRRRRGSPPPAESAAPASPPTPPSGGGTPPPPATEGGDPAPQFIFR